MKPKLIATLDEKNPVALEMRARIQRLSRLQSAKQIREVATALVIECAKLKDHRVRYSEECQKFAKVISDAGERITELEKLLEEIGRDLAKDAGPLADAFVPRIIAALPAPEPKKEGEPACPPS